MTNSSSHLLRQPVGPQIFIRRAIIFEFALAALQFLHLSIIAKSSVGDLLVWMLVHGVALLSLALLRHSARNCSQYPSIPWKVLATLLLVALVFKLSSRAPYIQSWLSVGLLETRNNAELGGNGWSTYGSIFFYPLSILLVFCTIPTKIFRALLFSVLLIIAIDFIAIGTRNAPVFVLIFYLLSWPVRFKLKKHMPMIFVLSILFVLIFNYSTTHRTQAFQEGGGYLLLFEFTISSEIMKIDDEIVAPLAREIPELMPVIFLSHYLTHSIGELRYFIDISDQLSLGGFYGIKDQLCVVGICDRVESQRAIENANPRAGVYQTMWTSLMLDFGYLGALLVYLGFVCALYFTQLGRKKIKISLIVCVVMIMVSSVENYFYNGLGFVQVLTIILIIPAINLFRFIKIA